MAKNHIEIESLDINNNKIFYKIHLPRGIKKFAESDIAFIEYDENISGVEKSILTVPIVSSLIPVAWAFGVDLILREIDATYLHSLEAVKAVFQRWYPQFSFSTRIKTQKISSNKFNGKKIGLLFSGGVDSLTSFIRLREKNPTLFTIFGADISLEKENLEYFVRSTISSFAKKNKVKVHFIRSNIPRLFNEVKLSKKFRLNSWWGSVSHGLILLSLVAPLTHKGIGKIFIASTHTKDFTYPWGSDPVIDNKIGWADVKVIHDAYEMSRIEKIKYLKKYPEYLKFLRVCYSSYSNYNCGRCEKCSHLLVSLLLENIPPDLCGFKIDKSTLAYIRNCLEKKQFILSESEKFLWKDIQRHIPEKISNELVPESKEFFEWLKHFNFDKYKVNKFQNFLFTVFHYFREYGIIKSIKKFIKKKLKIFLSHKNS